MRDLPSYKAQISSCSNEFDLKLPDDEIMEGSPGFRWNSAKRGERLEIDSAVILGLTEDIMIAPSP